MNGELYHINLSYESSSGDFVANVNGGYVKTTAANLTVAWGDDWTFDMNILGKRGANDRYIDGNVYGLTVKTAGVTYNITQDAIMNTPIPTHIVDYDVNFKTDWGALANERTITSGFIENTP